MADLAPTETQAPVPASRPQDNTSGGRINAGRYEIDSSRPLPHFSHAFADAYECFSGDTGQPDHVAIVIKDRYPVQRNAIDKCLSNEIKTLMALRTTLPVKWSDNSQRYALIYRQPPGKAIAVNNRPIYDALTEDVIRKSIIRPVFEALIGLGRLGLFHGNIRPDNIFCALNVNEDSEAVLGEFASSIPGINQPVLYETVERGMADPQGKGAGSISDDIYALGVTVSVLLHGRNPLEGKSDRQIIEDKIIHGSFAVFAEGLRLSPVMSEFLRATLNDDAHYRWGLEQLVSWMEGNRTPAKVSSLGVKAQRALDFNGKKYMRPRMLAKDLCDNVIEAAQLIENGMVVKWVERALNDQNMADTISAAISQANIGGHTPGFEDRLVCYVSMAMDPHAPIRFKGLKLFPQAIGHALAYAMLKGQPIQNFGELIRDRYGWVWLNHRLNAPDAHLTLVHAIDVASKTITRRGLDHGIERCLYELCPDVPCLSDLFKNHYVMNSYTLLLALNDIAPKSKDLKPIDRHIASFTVVRDTHDNAGLMLIIDGSDPMRRSLALLTLYQQIQKRADSPKLPQFCEWMSKDIDLVIQRYHNLPLKESLQKHVAKEIKVGDLNRILTMIDSPAQVRKDETDYAQAVKDYAAFSYERDTIRINLDLKKNFGQESGQYVAMVISLIISGALITTMILMRFTGGGF